jgi:hypothetical protein
VFESLSERRGDLEAVVVYFLIGGVALFAFAVLHFFGSTSSLFFRHLGFGMIILSVLGAVGLYLAVRATGDRWTAPGWSHAGRTAISGMAIVALVLSLAIVFPSPYIYSPSFHVTEAQTEGYRTAFAHAEEDVPFAGVRGGAERYSESFPAVEGKPSRTIIDADLDEGVPSFETDRYLVVTTTDEYREVWAYREFRVTRSEFRAVENDVDTSRVQSTGEFRLYRVPGGPAASPAGMTRDG